MCGYFLFYVNYFLSALPHIKIITKGHDFKMNQNNAKVFVRKELALLITAILSLVSGIIRVYFLFTAVEPSSGLYKFGTSAENIFRITVVVCVIAIAVLYFLSDRQKPSFPSPKHTAVIATSALAGLLLLFVFIYNIYRIFSKLVDLSLLFGLESAFALAGALYFFCNATENNETHSAISGVLSLCPPVFFALRLIAYFLDTSVIMTASQRHLMILYMCCAMMFLLYDAKISLPSPLATDEKGEKEEVKSHKNLFVLYFIFASLFIYFTVCGVLAHFTGWIFGAVTPDLPEVYYIADMVLGSYAVSKIFASTFKKTAA